MIGTSRRIRWSTTALAAATLAACSDSSTGPSSFEGMLNLDVAYVSAEVTLDDLVEGDFAPGGGAGAPAQQAGSGSVTYYDGSGAEMASYHPLLTASIRRQRSWERAGDRDGWTASMSRASDLTISGLLGQETERTWNGTGSGQVERSRFDDMRGDRTYDMSYTSVTSNVVRSVDRQANPWPLSGSIAHQVTVTRTDRDGGLVTHERTSVITFNGTQQATITVGGETFEVDLAARGGRGSPVRRR